MQAQKKRLNMGWFLPTNGDTATFGGPEIPRTLSNFLDVAQRAERAGFEYILIPVSPTCWDAWTTASFVAAGTKTIKPLVAMKPGFIHPVAHAKMIAAFSQFTGGRLHLNLIAGLSEKDSVSEGQLASKEARYRQLEEEVLLVKKLLSEKAVKFSGEFYHVDEPIILPDIESISCPEFFLGGGSEDALEISAKHSAVHLFWGDFPSRIEQQISEIRQRAAHHNRRDDIEFAMRLQIICRETEAEAWKAADRLISNAEEQKIKKQIRDAKLNSVANSRQQELAALNDNRLTPHLWSGLNNYRAGAGVAVVGNPRQVANQLMEFVDAGCSGFCLSGYPHANEAQIFGEHVMPLLRDYSVPALAEETL